MDDATCSELVLEVRDLARRGASVAEMCRTVQRRLGDVRVTYPAILVLYRAFDIGIADANGVGEWLGFESGNPGPDDAELEARFGARLRAAIRSGDADA